MSSNRLDKDGGPGPGILIIIGLILGIFSPILLPKKYKYLSLVFASFLYGFLIFFRLCSQYEIGELFDLLAPFYVIITIVEAHYIFDDTPSAGEFGSDGVIVRCSSGDLEGYRVKTLLIIDDGPPDSPVINGQTSGKVGEEYDYEFFSTDPDGDDLYYFVEWGDDTNSGWKGPFESGVKMILIHKWDEEGTFYIRAKAKDDYGAESGWGELGVTMPRDKIFHNSLFVWLSDRFTDVFPILRYIFRLAS